MSTRDLDRRALLRLGGAMGLLGAGGPLALQLAAAGSASAQSATDYKALVCVFLFGGNDGHNTVLATDADSWGRYFTTRNTGISPIALMPMGTAPTPVGQISPITGRTSQAGTPESWGGVLPITPSTPQAVPPGTNASVRTFGLHPFLGPVKTMFDAGRLAVLANVGTLIQPITKAQYSPGCPLVPRSLFSHNDQQSTWQSGSVEGAHVGWGGAMADTLFTLNGSNSIFTAISANGGALFLSGRNIGQYAVNPGRLPATLVSAIQTPALFTSPIGGSSVASLTQDMTSTSDFANDYAAVVKRSIGAAASVNTAVAQGAAATVPAPPNYVNPFTGASQPNGLALQLQAVAELIAAGPQLGLRRQVFFVGLSSFDTHNAQNGRQSDLLGQLAQALAYFDGTLSNLGGADLRSLVTTFTASDFGRTFNTNGDGTDHAWGSHQFIMGGAVKGGAIYGQYPTLGIDQGSFSNPDMVGNALIPTTAVYQYGATLGSWFGVSPSDLAGIFPNLGAFATANLGFV
jgi:uncharacterized protein (DUF1501 family)